MATLQEYAIRIAAEIARQFEGLYLRPYLCPAGVPTIGFGATFYEDGTMVTLLDPPITKERAEALLQHELRYTFLPAVIKLCPNALSSPQRLGALVDFAFNLGAGNLRASTLRKRIADGDWESARREIMRWNKSGGVELKGLTRRRMAERALL